MTDVLHVISGLGMGGAETMLAQLAIGLRRRGLSQQVVSLSELDCHAVDLREAGVEVTVFQAAGAASVLGALGGLHGVLSRLRPRILHGWMYHGNIAATLCHYLCRGRRTRKLAWNLRASNMDEDRYGRIIRLSALLSRLPDIVVTNSQAGAAFHRSRGFRAAQFLTIDNGVDTAKFQPDATNRKRLRAELGLAEDAVLAIHVARVDPMKDHATFLAAMAKTPKVIGLVIGSGTERLTVPDNVRALGLRRDVAQVLAAGDIVVSTSAYGEGFSNVIAEGMSAGLVPIATDVGDSRRIVGDAGVIVAPRHALAFSQALSATASLPADQRRRRGLQARDRIVTHFSLESAIQRYYELYLTTMSAR
jgi:glycosyltransferase involved in cell wall biosynthesis